MKNPIKKYKFYLKELLFNSRTSCYLNQEINAHQKISKLFEDQCFIPETTYSISSVTILHVLNEIVINKKKSIIEFGGGVSTIYIAQLIKVLKLNTSFISVESDEDWVVELNRILGLNGLEKNVKIIYSPLKGVKSEMAFKTQLFWYNTNILDLELRDFSNFDLILIDGPFTKDSKYSRFSAIPYLKNKLDSFSSIFLDDTDRNDELEILKEWENILEINAIRFERYSFMASGSSFKSSPFNSSPFRKK
jgi:predicted O-methyltransferase YrrM